MLERMDGWVGTWATVVTEVPAGVATAFADQTLRQVVRVSVGGDAVRVRLSNEFGTEPLVLGAARVALGAGAAAIVPGSDRALTFGGRRSVPAGAAVTSDPVALAVPDRADLAVSLHLPEPTAAATTHAFAFATSYVVAGDATAAVDVAPAAPIGQWYFLSGVSVHNPHSPGALVALGDSITDGGNSTGGTNRRWPDLLAGRLLASGRAVGVLNAGICGNRLLHDPNPLPGSEDVAAYFGQAALRRFDRDVAARPGARWLVLLLGINDLGHPGSVAPSAEAVTPAEIIAGYERVVARARALGLRVYGGTIMPARGFLGVPQERARQEVNAWVRDGGGLDAVIDFDAAMRDPHRPGQLAAAYDSGDRLHPNDAGMQAMADAVPLDLFGPSTSVRTRSSRRHGPT
jgi:lysophospholipase L1-like esterase